MLHSLGKCIVINAELAIGLRLNHRSSLWKTAEFAHILIARYNDCYDVWLYNKQLRQTEDNRGQHHSGVDPTSLTLVFAVLMRAAWPPRELT